MQFPLPDQRKLLELASTDAELAQVRHRLRAAPLVARVRELEDQVGAVHRQVVEARTQIEDLDRGVARSEGELDKVKARLVRDRELADQGLGAKVQRELEHELGSLTRRLSDLEDAELEMLERQESLADQVAALQAKEAELAETLATSRAERDDAHAGHRGHEAQLVATRAALVASLPAALVSAYEAARRDARTGAAQLVGSQCSGCRLELPPNEVGRLRSLPPEQIEHCDECGCIIVRVD